MKGIMITGDYSQFMREFEMAKTLFSSQGLDVDFVDYNDIEVTAMDTFDGRVRIRGEMVECPDFVFIMTTEERETYQLKAVLRMFETLGVVCVNTYDAVEKAGDKLYSFQIAKQAVPGIRIPDTMLVGPNTSLDSIAERIGFPLVMKIMHGYQGRGVCLVESMGELKSILDMVMAAPFGDQIIVQRAIQSSKGRDLRVVVGAGELVYAFVRHNDGDFKSNLHQGGYIEPYQPPQELVEQSIRLADAFGLKTGSIDYLFGENEGEFYLCEVNSVPGISYVFKAQKEGDDELVRRFFSMPKKILHREGLI